MHDELVTARGPPQITAAVVPTHTVKSETEPLLQQEARYYQSVPEVAIHFNTPSSEPCPQLDSQNWRPTVKKENQKVEGANWFGIFLAFLSGAFFTLSSAGVKGLTSVDPMELLVVRSLLQIAVMLSVAIRNGENLLGPKGQRGLLQLQVKKKKRRCLLHKRGILDNTHFYVLPFLINLALLILVGHIKGLRLLSCLYV